ncbi:sugar phosphate isomerase/epimerase [Lewinella sp. W8]|uniref:sugar phosphate isomerase/epimerase family protein n=1 Tax=Lewinella sp. W8 TaxID=2528208 RepID=UPI00106781AF|nr:sugar phosphate isomerase/epimerase family protein [Lewinella sp. W8]MTB50494.1 TIM barrel protein [Lewinella sp. W8]
MHRRSFLSTGLLLPTGVALAATTTKPSPPNTSLRVSLKADAIGVSGSPTEMLEGAIKHGYDALSVPAQWLEGMTAKERQGFAARARSNDISWGANGLPIEFRRSEQQFRADLGALPQHAANLRSIGVTRIGTWIMPCHESLTYRDNFDQHASRLRDAARILREEGIRLGLEYIGTRSLRHSQRFAFISTGRELRQLIDAIGEENVGVILDSFHWYTSGESVEDLKQWSNEEIVAVDVNDANPKLSREDQADTARELPGASGVIDLNGFLGFLHERKYEGPVRAEPFSATLNGMDNDLAMAATYAAVAGSIERAIKG